MVIRDPLRPVLTVAVAACVLLPVRGSARAVADATGDIPHAMIRVPAGTVVMGSDAGLPDELPRHTVNVESFALDRGPVTVGRFAEFVAATGYVTSAERFGSSGVLSYETGEWELRDSATWRKPRGPNGPDAETDHPVVHVSWNDAKACCEHMGKRLPTEAEWEHAARNGRNGSTAYAFGDAVRKDDAYLANIWTGDFPVDNTAEDGHLYTSPVGAYGETDLGLTDMAGNVWEWVQDWYLPYGTDASGFAPDDTSERVQRGGSFLCEPTVCHGYRVSARGHSTPESSHMHVGFRCAEDIAP